MLNDRDLQELLARAGQVGLEAEHRREARLIDDAVELAVRKVMRSDHPKRSSFQTSASLL